MSAIAIKEEVRLTAEEGRAELRRMIEEGGHVEAARSLSRRLAVWYPEDEAVQYWAWVLAPPRVIGTSPASGIPGGQTKTTRWVKKHALEYRGKWIAARAGELVGVESDRETLLNRLSELPGGVADVFMMQVRPWIAGP